jgi:hypothetical protein
MTQQCQALFWFLGTGVNRLSSESSLPTQPADSSVSHYTHYSDSHREGLSFEAGFGPTVTEARGWQRKHMEVCLLTYPEVGSPGLEGGPTSTQGPRLLQCICSNVLYM